MATSMPNPQAAAPGADAGAAGQQPDQGGQSVNPLQTILGRLAIMLPGKLGLVRLRLIPINFEQLFNAHQVLGAQNQVIQPEMRRQRPRSRSPKQKITQGQQGSAPPQRGMDQPQEPQGQPQQPQSSNGTQIQPEMQQAASAVISALQKSSQAAPGPAQPMSAPAQG